MKFCSIGLRSRDWLGHCRIFHFFTFKNSWVAFAVLYVLGHHPCLLWSTAQSTLLHLAEPGQRVYPYTRLLLSSVSSSLNTSNPVPLEAMLIYHTDVVSFGSWAVPSLLHTFSSPSFWYKLILTPKNAFQKWSGFFRCFFWPSLIWPRLHLVVKPLNLLWWSLLLIEDFDSDTSASWRVFFTWLDVEKGFFFTTERILWPSTTVVLCGRPGLFMFLCSPAH